MIRAIASGKISKGPITRTLSIYPVAADAYSLDIVETATGPTGAPLAAAESTSYIVGASEDEARAYARTAWKRLLSFGWTRTA